MTLFASFPAALISTVAGIALLSPFISALQQSMQEEDQCWPAMVTFTVRASGVGYLGLGTPFWGLMAGLAVLLLSRLQVKMRDAVKH